jgi:hypothetical protein
VWLTKKSKLYKNLFKKYSLILPNKNIMRILKNLFIICFLLIGILLEAILLIRIETYYTLKRREKEFLDKYEYEDFSQFKGINMWIRGYDDSGKILITGSIEFLKNE